MLARRYAQAYYNIFTDACTVQVVPRIKKLCSFFVTHKKSVFFLGLPQLTIKEKEAALKKLMSTLELPQEMVLVFLLLIVQKRAYLIPYVCEQLCCLILDKNNILECTIATSHALKESEKESVRDFFAQQTHRVVQPQYVIDKTLIAGISITSSLYQWEYSIRKQLQMINQKLII